MAKVYIGFIDSDDGTVDLTFHSDDPMELDSPPEDLTEAQDMAVIALNLLAEYLKSQNADMIDVENLKSSNLN